MAQTKNCLAGVAFFLTCLFHNIPAVAQQPAPPDKPATIHISGQQLTISYHGQTIFAAAINIDKSQIGINEVNDTSGEAISQVIKFTSLSDKPITITGIVSASGESFPCSVDRPMIASADIVRTSVGLSHSLLNRAIYDRKWDWVLSVDYFSAVTIEPVTADTSQNSFRVTVSGTEISIRFRPHYYQVHRGLSYYQPWTYKIWKQSVAGWCSWYAYLDDISEEKIKTAANAVAGELMPYGYSYIQMDDGYQQPKIGFPATWLQANDKFPSGLSSLADYIRAKGLIPAIWSNVSFQDKDSAFANKDLFVQNEKKEPAEGRWVGYALDGSNPLAINKIIRPVYRGLKAMGWHYFKVDALRHLRYEGYNSNTAFFENKHIDRELAYRNVVTAIREELGKDNFILGCWGIRPELIGLIDACRIGDDGYSWQELAQYNSFNNIVWRNDPDHIQLTKNAYRDCMLTSMAGAVLMLTDKPSEYQTGNIEPAIRTAPVLFTRPGQLYDVDPSRSINLAQVKTEMSGSGSRIFDASRNTPYDLFLEEINMPYENWMLLGRAGENKKFISFTELGLDAKKNYLVFEFWSKSFIGQYSGGFVPGAIDTMYNCQLFCIRQLQDHPQLLATSRHISCGAQELTDLSWNNNILFGSSQLPPNSVYTIYIYEPPGTTYASFTCTGANFTSTAKKNDIREIQLRPTDTSVKWRVNYR